jgi:hypothetical protein
MVNELLTSSSKSWYNFLYTYKSEEWSNPCAFTCFFHLASLCLTRWLLQGDLLIRFFFIKSHKPDYKRRTVCMSGFLIKCVADYFYVLVKGFDSAASANWPFEWKDALSAFEPFEDWELTHLMGSRSSETFDCLRIFYKVI